MEEQLFLEVLSTIDGRYFLTAREIAGTHPEVLRGHWGVNSLDHSSKRRTGFSIRGSEHLVGGMASILEQLSLLSYSQR